MSILGNTIGGNLQSESTRSYNSFSGSDIRAVIGNRTFAEMQAVSYSVTREKAPIYTMGSANVRAFSRNKRGIAGTIIWVNFDRHALLNLIYTMGGTFVANVDDVRPQFLSDANVYASQTAVFQNSLVRPSGIDAGATIDQLDTPLSSVSGKNVLAKAQYSDQILPFDITLAGTNEQGAAMAMKIFGVEILNEGTGISIDDSVAEFNATFVALNVEPWTIVQSAFTTGLGGTI